jgi:hypothetical protein
MGARLRDVMVGRSVSRCSDPFIANVAFEALSCHQPFEDGSTYVSQEGLEPWRFPCAVETPAIDPLWQLITDVDIDCRSDYYYSMVLPRAWSAVLIYCFGLLIFNGVLLVSAGRAISQKKHTPLSRAVRFLYFEVRAGDRTQDLSRS